MTVEAHTGSATSSHPDVRVVILAAGLGTRLGRPLPKPLTSLSDGRTILRSQIDNIRAVFGEAAQIMVVVGFKLEAILEAAPDVSFAYNEAYDQTNTSKSLLRALRLTGPGGVLWLNGDVVFDQRVLERVSPLVAEEKSFICVNTAVVGDEEVKYRIGDDGMITELSKSVVDGLGEAVGINFVSSGDKQNLARRLVEVDDQAYFERAIELTIENDAAQYLPVDISDLFAIEVDFEEDLERANKESLLHGARRTTR